MKPPNFKFTIDPGSGVTLAEQIRQQLIWLITSGEIEAGETLPSIRLLASQLAVNLHTIRKVYSQLEQDGFVRTGHGKRAVVIPYTTTSLARIARVRRSHTIGVILPKLSNPFYHRFLDGVDEIARQAGSMIFVCSSREDPGEVFRCAAQLSARHVDGIIIVSQNPDVRLLQGEGEQVRPGLPVVTVDWPGVDRNVVLLDSENAGYLAAHHLVEHGHRRIGLLTVNFEAPNITPVNLGYEKALQEAGIRLDPRFVVRVDDFGIASGTAGMDRLLALPVRPTALFAIADTLALGAMRAIKKRGLRIPGDIALASFNNIEYSDLADPPLTTVDVPVREMGVKAMQMLQKLILGVTPRPKKVVLQASLVVRRSCGCKES